MLDQDTCDKLKQKKFDAHCSINTHKYFISQLQFRLQIIDILAVTVPIAFLTMQYLVAKNEQVTQILAIINTILSSSLLIMVIISHIYGWGRKLYDHQFFLASNLPIIDEIDEVLKDNSSSRKDAKRIFDKTTALDKQEILLLPQIDENKRKMFYREALKSGGDINVKCPRCNSSPWQYKEGDCQLCGNEATS